MISEYKRRFNRFLLQMKKIKGIDSGSYQIIIKNVKSKCIIKILESGIIIIFILH